MGTIVRKYGGSSLATVEKIHRAAADLAAVHSPASPVAVVVSARGRTTDELLSTAAEVTATPSPRETDQLLATGEYASAAQLAMALHHLGVEAVSLTGGQAGITATGRHGAGMIHTIDTRRIREHLGRGELVVIAGFHGIDKRGDVVTLGRGGSDTTAVALAAAMSVGVCEILTDVDGIFTADPRIVAQARVLPSVDAAVMTEMAFAGAQVLHSRAVELALVSGVRIVVRNSFGTSPGSTIVGRSGRKMIETAGFLTAVAHDAGTTLIRVRSTGDPRPELAAEFLAGLAERRVPVDMVAWTGADRPGLMLGMAVPTDHLAETRAAADELGDESDYEIDIDEPVGKLSLVGTGLLNRPEYTARMLAALSAIGVTPCWMTTTQQRTSVLVPAVHLAGAVRALHDTFELDRVELASVTPA